VGIGTASPSANLHIQNIGSTGGTIQIGTTAVDGGTSRISLYGSDNYVGFRHRNVNSGNDVAYVRGFPSNLGIDSAGALAFGTSPAGSTVAERMRIDSVGNVLATGGFIPGNTSRLVVRGFSPGSYNNTFSQSNATVQILSNEMNNDTWNPTLNITTIRQSLTTGKDSFGGIGFSTIDDSNDNGMNDAGRIAIVNELPAATSSGTAMAFYTQAGSVTRTNAATERLRIESTGSSLFRTKKVGIGTQTGNSKEVQTISYSGSATNGTIDLLTNTAFGENGHCGMFFLNVTTAGKGVSRIYFLTGRFGACILTMYQGGNRGAGEDATLQLVGGANTIGLQLVLSGWSGSQVYYVSGWIGLTTSYYDNWFSN
jgi:hypothetical protein